MLNISLMKVSERRFIVVKFETKPSSWYSDLGMKGNGVMLVRSIALTKPLAHSEAIKYAMNYAESQNALVSNEEFNEKWRESV